MSRRWGDRVLAQHLANDEARRALAAAEALPTPPKPGKYASKKVEQGGITFDSAKEARRWLELEQLARAGKITDLKRQVRFVLAPAVLLAGEARTKPALRYFADATYIQGGQLVVEDTKSDPTRTKEAYRIKKHLMKTVHGLDIREI